MSIREAKKIKFSEFQKSRMVRSGKKISFTSCLRIGDLILGAAERRIPSGM